MPEKKNERLIKLPPETRLRLEDLESEIAAAEKAIKTLEELGLDIRPLQDKLDWSKKVSTALLREFK